MIMRTNLPLSKKIFFSLVVVISFFLVLELTIRVYHYVKFKEKNYLFYGDAFFKTLMKEGKYHNLGKIYYPYLVSVEADNVFLKRKEFPLAQDCSRYFRSWNFTIEKMPNTIRIIALGGSFVFGTGLRDTEAWPYLLGEELNKHSTDKIYEVMNCNVRGGDINNVLIRLIKYAVPLKPDYVILCSVYNNQTLALPQYKTSFAWRVSHFLYNISRFYSTVRDKVAIILSRDIYLFHDNYDVVVTENDVEHAITIYRNRLKQALIVCRENNATLILCLQPIFLPESLKNLQSLLDEKQMIELGEKIKRKGRLSHYEFRYYMQARLNLEVKRFAASEGILLFDGVSIFPKDKHLYFIDVIHPNSKGAAIFAKELFLFFVKNGIAR